MSPAEAGLFPPNILQEKGKAKTSSAAPAGETCHSLVVDQTSEDRGLEEEVGAGEGQR